MYTGELHFVGRVGDGAWGERDWKGRDCISPKVK